MRNDPTHIVEIHVVGKIRITDFGYWLIENKPIPETCEVHQSVRSADELPVSFIGIVAGRSGTIKNSSLRRLEENPSFRRRVAFQPIHDPLRVFSDSFNLGW